MPGLSAEDRRAVAGVLQLLYSAYSWLSLREQWDMTGEEAAEAVGWAARTLINDLKHPNHVAIAGRLDRKRARK